MEEKILMSILLGTIAFCLIGYALGGIPTAHIFASKKHIDLRKRGSGNLGATNLSRSLGWRLGVLVGVLDLLKGVVPSMVALVFFTLPNSSVLFVGMFTILGHIYTPYLASHRGGKGVATGAGVIAVFFPSAILFGLFVFFTVAAITRYISLASMATYILLIPYYVFTSMILNLPIEYAKLAFLVILSLLIIGTHKENVKRLLGNTEPKFSFATDKESV
ncbi:MAG TPA: glycerol-3-phosphate 1-O-acyltransferase PlsY [Sphaerochaeta sp.]|nr:glycerol-3-phosphate 1-O-acyltransferase PlsY [Sphaerochaeta sp.]